MDYNEYDGNGNKKKFNLLEMLSDKQQRSRVFLFIYLVLFILLIIIVRVNLSSSLNNNNVDNNKEIVDNTNKEEKTKDETETIINESDMFSFLDLNNYTFKYSIKMGDSLSIIEGKRYNDKFSFTLENAGSVLYFSGTMNYIKAKESLDGESKLTGFPYVLVNIFDVRVLKNIINSATINNDKYEITNETIGNVVKYNKLDNKGEINTIELVKKNNKITGIEMDLSKAISDYVNENTSAIISLSFSDFGLVDDFNI